MVNNTKKIFFSTEHPSQTQLATHIIWVFFNSYWVKLFISYNVYLIGTMLYIVLLSPFIQNYTLSLFIMSLNIFLKFNF